MKIRVVWSWEGWIRGGTIELDVDDPKDTRTIQRSIARRNGRPEWASRVVIASVVQL